jgi:hypothetical protein
VDLFSDSIPALRDLALPVHNATNGSSLILNKTLKSPTEFMHRNVMFIDAEAFHRRDPF